jgi:hypothetical protein
MPSTLNKAVITPATPMSTAWWMSSRNDGIPLDIYREQVLDEFIKEESRGWSHSLTLVWSNYGKMV